jgi:hypothetical protein
LKDWEVQAVLSSDLPAQIDAGIDFVDSCKLDDDPLVRLLTAPAYFFTAFWLESKKGDTVVVIAQPDWFKHLTMRRVYNSSEFLTLLGQEEPVQGLPQKVPQSA